ncbi:hypothetical protein DPMN_014393 [Dreissena polymorpha]|uniref:Uncharacterized protein n=1 Tax=Dreissena polymorpha TaxID=45954 RepID=A0A9D4N5X9_DREPO|nr:hypothetical protein DPMN_014393 [Dreissena polymorpha]
MPEILLIDVTKEFALRRLQKVSRQCKPFPTLIRSPKSSLEALMKSIEAMQALFDTDSTHVNFINIR